MMSSKNNGFTAGDIQRYHTGKMSPPERHALEKAALDDPFLADALEGYAFTTTSEADLDSIQSRLKEKIGRKKVVPLFQKYRWLSAAAIVLIIAGAGWLTYTISQRNHSTSIAQKKEVPAKPEVSNKGIGTTQDNTVNTEEGKNVVLQESKKGLAEGSQLNGEAAQQDNGEGFTTNSDKDFSTKETRNEVSEKTQTAPPPAVVNIQSSAENGTLASRRGMARNNDALRYPTNTATNIELYNRDLKDSNSLAGAPMRISEPISTDSVKHMSIVLQRLPNDSTKEVVLNSGRLKSVAKYPKVVIDTLEPAEGYVVFDDYVINNLKVPDEFKTKPLSGDVQLSFDVDANGQPVNITVVKSLCQTCDAEAIRLLKEGPKWKKKSNKKGKVTFRF